jgi:peptidoglycan/xylan/chitin deacetylase (PgdA/CDA1 family)
VFGRNKLAILTFHRVSTDTERYFIPPMSTSEKNFKKILELIVDRFSPIPLEEAVERLKKGVDLPIRAVSLTFDDGYTDNFTVALDFLNKYGIKATFFIPVTQIENQETYWWDLLYQIGIENPKALAIMADQQKALPQGIISLLEEMSGKTWKEQESICRECVRLLNGTNAAKREQFIGQLNQLSIPGHFPQLLVNWDEVREISRQGHDIGSHTLSHHPLTQLSEVDARKEIVESKVALSRKIGKEVVGFSYPRGDWNQAVANLVAQAGYSYAVTTRYGRNGSSTDVYGLARFNISDYQGIRAYMAKTMYYLEMAGFLDKLLIGRRSG